MNAEVLRLIKRYDRLSRSLERQAIERLDGAIDASYKSLEQEFLRQYPNIQSQGSLLAAQRRAVLLNDLGGLLQIIEPEREAEYEQMFDRLIRGSYTLGGDLGGALISAIAPNSFVRAFAGVNLEAAALQARDGVRRLYRYNDEFRSKASAIVEQGIIQGWGARRVAGVLRSEMAIAKYNAERIARTEVLSALNDGAQLRYQQNGVDGVQLVVSIGEVCPYCVARNGNVYEVGKIRVPLHPFCRCVLVCWRREWQEMGLTDDDFTRQYRDARLADLRTEGKEPNYGLSPFERMAKLDRPPEPIWTP
ncbi:MAG: minor capsid protein [Oculatellaceae cyanobacterium bins.114]|nr:minor capsid protein [Oculatellaceae cyanobacterium bins.114]